jgi:uncharacterized membrane protein YdjX (TVP38/TMEM64 family)
VRVIIVFLVLAVILAAPFLLFGEQFEHGLAGEHGIARLREFGPWAWIIGIGLIVADVVLPVPATVVMTALGVLYGAVLGGLISAVGSVLAGLTAYAATRALGPRAAIFLVGQRDLIRARTFFERSGGWAVALSRPMPILPEIVACLAGLARMPAHRFVTALVCGSLPMAFVCAGLGAVGENRPLLAVIVSGLAPAALWPVARRLLKPVEAPPAPDGAQRDVCEAGCDAVAERER